MPRTDGLKDLPNLTPLFLTARREHPSDLRSTRFTLRSNTHSALAKTEV